ncbi:thialysine N-epsilon-acetyltransferase [Chironomus tepperi]|uniref:thialysine N-epsilon-acetyltransferase n=1 Tax=Chironomus tepperi TaxID=113505 RepID=UPI00391FBB8B
MSKLTVRRTTADDLDDIIAMIQELADFEKMPNGPQLTKLDLLRDGNFDASNSAPLFYSFVAEIQENIKPKLIGYSIGFFTYSTWQGKAYLMEDIYVKPAYRMTGVGKQLFLKNVKFANDQNCSRFDFHVLDWNPAKGFYEKLGAENLTKSEGWEFFRLNKEKMIKLCED